MFAWWVPNVSSALNTFLSPHLFSFFCLVLTSALEGCSPPVTYVFMQELKNPSMKQLGTTIPNQEANCIWRTEEKPMNRPEYHYECSAIEWKRERANGGSTNWEQDLCFVVNVGRRWHAPHPPLIEGNGRKGLIQISCNQPQIKVKIFDCWTVQWQKIVRAHENYLHKIMYVWY